MNRRWSHIVLGSLVAGLLLALAPSALRGAAFAAGDGDPSAALALQAPGVDVGGLDLPDDQGGPIIRPVDPSTGAALRPVARNCTAQCGAKAADLLQKCVAAGNDPNTCIERARTLLNDCLAKCEANPAPPAPGTCLDDCATKAREALKTCLENGGTQERCDAAAKKLLADCQAACRAGTGVTPPPGSAGQCRADCEQRAKDAAQKCVEQGNDPAACRERARQVLERCLAGCQPPGVTPPPGAGQCQTDCEARAQQAAQKCLERGNDPAACRERARQMLEDCLAGCPGAGVTPPNPGQPDPGQCRADCQKRADAALKDCLAAGNDPAACREKAKAVLDDCLTRCTAAGVTPPPTCEEKCAQVGRDVYDDCMKTSTSPDPAACREKAAEAVRECQAGCTPPPDPGNACEVRCRAAANAQLATCLANGGSQADCTAQAKAFFDRCVAENCSGG